MHTQISSSPDGPLPSISPFLLLLFCSFSSLLLDSTTPLCDVAVDCVEKVRVLARARARTRPCLPALALLGFLAIF